MRNTIVRLMRRAGITHKYVLLNVPYHEHKGVNPGYMKGGLIKAEVLEETEKALSLRFSMTFLPLTFGVRISTHIFDEWMLKNDKRIVEVLE